MLDNLLEIEVAYSLLKSGGDDEKDPIDVNYEKLNTKLEVLLKSVFLHLTLLQFNSITTVTILAKHISL